MQLKICGVRSLEMYQLCKDLQVDYLGLNFVPDSKRKASPEFCEIITHATEIPKVGIFRNQTIEEIIHFQALTKLDIIQLHGQESDQFIDDLKLALTPNHTTHPIPIWKALSVDANFNPKNLEIYCQTCQLMLLDGSNPGSGLPIENTKLLEETCKKCEELKIPYGIAGGINAQNIPNLKQKYAKATLLDTASGVEIDGLFDPARCRALINNFKNYS